jgi:hypothetical protein
LPAGGIDRKFNPIEELPNLRINEFLRRSLNSSILQSVNRYNVPVADEPKSRVVSAETIGLIVIAVMLAIMILVRWAGIIHWSAR